MRKQTSIFLVLIGLLFLAGCGGNTSAPATLAVREFPLPQSDVGSQWITTGPDDNLWFTELDRAQIGRITSAGQATEFPMPATPYGITAGPDGDVWVALGSEIGQVTPAGKITTFLLPAHSFAKEMTTGRDGGLWFTQLDNKQIGRFTPPR